MECGRRHKMPLISLKKIIYLRYARRLTYPDDPIPCDCAKSRSGSARAGNFDENTARAAASFIIFPPPWERYSYLVKSALIIAPIVYTIVNDNCTTLQRARVYDCIQQSPRCVTDSGDTDDVRRHN